MKYEAAVLIEFNSKEEAEDFYDRLNSDWRLDGIPVPKKTRMTVCVESSWVRAFAALGKAFVKEQGQ